MTSCLDSPRHSRTSITRLRGAARFGRRDHVYLHLLPFLTYVQYTMPPSPVEYKRIPCCSNCGARLDPRGLTRLGVQGWHVVSLYAEPCEHCDATSTCVLLERAISADAAAALIAGMDAQRAAAIDAGSPPSRRRAR